MDCYRHVARPPLLMRLLPLIDVITQQDLPKELLKGLDVPERNHESHPYVTFYNELYAFDWVRHEWAKLKPNGTPPSRRYGHQSVRAPDGRMIVFGGFNGTFLADVHELSPAAGFTTHQTRTTGSQTRNIYMTRLAILYK